MSKELASIVSTSRAIRKLLGQAAENIAAELLVSKGWVIVARNFRFRCGEIDIIAEKNQTLVFIEVKCANKMTYNDLGTVLGATKRSTIIKTSKLFLAMNRKYNQHHLRYDVMLIKNGTCIKHVEGAFTENDKTQ